MSKKFKSALVPPKQEKTKRGRKIAGGTSTAEKHVKGGILTVHHPPGAPVTNGAQERRAMFKWRAMELKLQGLILREIADRIQEDFELTDAPGISTVDEWLDEAFAEAWTAKQSDADRHCTVIMLRTEKVLAKLLPVALGNVIVSRTRIMDGAPVEILDEKAIDEMLRAAAEARRYLELQAKVLKVGRVGEAGGEDGAVNGHHLTMIIEKAVTNNIVLSGTPPTAHNTLVMAAGDKVIDILDGEAAQHGHTSSSSI